MAVHPGAATVEQDRAVGAGAYGLVDGPAHGWWQRDAFETGQVGTHRQPR
jgi:hypothetical protein